MPYIITTESTERDPFGNVFPDVRRRAVASLDEARNVACDAIKPLIPAFDLEDRGVRAGFLEAWHDASILPKSGATFGPLPDGTVVEIERVGMGTLASRAGFAQFSDERADADIIDAFNAQ